MLYLAAAELAAQLLTVGRYGIFRDELYYLACSEHLDFGYVDQPPLIAVVAWLERHIGGDSLLSLRFLPALAGAAAVWLAGRMARALGGGRYAQALAALAVLIAGGNLAFFHLLTMNAFDPLIWTACAYLVMRIIQTGNQKLWPWFGALAGAGLENKYAILFFGFGVAIGLLLTPERKALKQRWIWLALALALVIWLPNLVWNFEHHWPFLELLHNVRRSGRDVALSLAPYLLAQVFFMNPVSAPIWLAGTWWYFFGRDRARAAEGDGASAGRVAGLRGRYRVLGWTFVAILAAMVILGGKAYYIWPAYPMLFAGGAVAIELWFERLRGRWPKPAYAVLLVVGGAVLAPVALPVLSPERFIWYETTLHLVPPAVEHQQTGPLQHQLYADMFGWEEMARDVARAYHSLPPEVRNRTAIAAGGYGQAGAIDFFGPKYGLPKAISGHQSYWLWGPRGYTGESMLILDMSRKRVEEICDQWQVVGRTDHPLSRRDEHFDIYWCRQHRWTLEQVWPQAKHWD